MDPLSKQNEDELSLADESRHEERAPDDLCVNVINEAVAGTPGIVGVRLDTDQQELSIDYDSDQITKPTVEQLAQLINP